MRFRYIQPSEILKDYIDYFFVMESREGGESYTVEVFPVPRVEMAFTYGKKNSIYGQVGTEEEFQVQDVVVDGFFNRKASYSNRADFLGTIVVGFKPWGIQPYLDMNIGEFSNQNVDMAHFYPRQVRIIEDQIRTMENDEQRVGVIEQFLLEIIRPHQSDNLIKHAVQLIGMTHGQMPIGMLAKQHYLSEKQFKRRFIQTVGIPPKHYSRIVRLQNILVRLDSRQFKSLDIALEAGFFDQAHFIKEFKEFTNFTPKEYLNNKDITELNNSYSEQIEKSVFYNTICK